MNKGPVISRDSPLPRGVKCVFEVQCAARAMKQGGHNGSVGGFTLIELLVVIGVIAILASLVLPTLSRARMAADSAVCQSNLRQQAIGLAYYVEDFHAY